MTLIALVSIKGSPGLTTAATAMAASWPEGRRVLLVEADPFGGDLAARYGATVTTGLASLFAAARRTLSPGVVWEHAHELPGGLPVLFGLTTVQQAMANEGMWPAIADALDGLDADVIVDGGRLLPSFGGGVREVLARADAVMVLCEPTLESIVHLRDALPSLVAELHGTRMVVIATEAKGYSASQIEQTLEVTVGRSLPHDPAGAAALAGRATTKRLATMALLKWATGVISDLGIEPSAHHDEPSTGSQRARGQRSGEQPRSEQTAARRLSPMKRLQPLLISMRATASALPAHLGSKVSVSRASADEHPQIKNFTDQPSALADQQSADRQSADQCPPISISRSVPVETSISRSVSVDEGPQIPDGGPVIDLEVR